NPLPSFLIRLCAFRSARILSKIPLIKVLLFKVLNDFDSSIYSLMVTLTGIVGKLINSVIAIRINRLSSKAIRSDSQFLVFAAIISWYSSAYLMVIFNRSIMKSLSSNQLGVKSANLFLAGTSELKFLKVLAIIA